MGGIMNSEARICPCYDPALSLCGDVASCSLIPSYTRATLCTTRKAMCAEEVANALHSSPLPLSDLEETFLPPLRVAPTLPELKASSIFHHVGRPRHVGGHHQCVGRPSRLYKLSNDSG